MVDGALTFRELNMATWPDFEALFGANGACGGCWCQTWRRGKADFESGKGEGNKLAMKALVNAGEPAGILAYVDAEVAGWCSVAPREQFPRLEKLRILRPVDDRPVWAVSCLFIAKKFRNQGLSAALLDAAAAFARAKGAAVIEGYPHDIEKALPAPFVWTGLLPAYLKAGFAEAARRSANRPIVRRYLE